ncbi:MAG: response regulator [Proteobacteria bacterium]|nr:response regulator [Pseudomonadota bacterium]
MTLPRLEAAVLSINEVALDGLARQLRNLDFDVAAFTDPTLALGCLAVQRPHVLLIDFAMPTLSGSDFVAQVRATAGGREPPVVAMGDVLIPEVPDGCAAWLTTPVWEVELLEALRLALAESPEAKRSEPVRRRGRRDTEPVSQAPLTLFGSEGRIQAAIESTRPDSLRVLHDAELPVGSVWRAQVPWKDNRIRLVLRVAATSEADDGWHCGLAVEQAEPPHWWRRFLAARG